MKYRSGSEIVRSILEAANASEGTSRTRLMYKSYLPEKTLENFAAKCSDRLRSRKAVLQNYRERYTIIAVAE
jgi:predicted transcriptional regulator